MTVAPHLHFNFRTKVGIMYLIDSDDFFLEITIFLGRKGRFLTLIESEDLEFTLFRDKKNLVQ